MQAKRPKLSKDRCNNRPEGHVKKSKRTGIKKLKKALAAS